MKNLSSRVTRTNFAAERRILANGNEGLAEVNRAAGAPGRMLVAVDRSGFNRSAEAVEHRHQARHGRLPPITGELNAVACMSRLASVFFSENTRLTCASRLGNLTPDENNTSNHA